MSDKVKKVISFLAGANLANGTYEDCEKQAVVMIGEKLGVAEAEFLGLVDAEMAKQKAFSDEEQDNFYCEISEGIEEEDALEIYSYCLELVFSDGEFSRDEVEVMVAFAEVLDIEIEDAILMMIAECMPEIEFD